MASKRNVQRDPKTGRFVKEKVFSPNWQPVSGGYFSGTYDAFNSKPEPNKLQLEQAFQDTVYACASLIANKVATTPVKLFVKTSPGEPRPKCQTKAVKATTLARLYDQRSYSPNVSINEVVEHPALSLLCRVNACYNYHELIGLTQLYLDLTGNAYWLIKPDHFGLPAEIYPLPAHSVAPIRDDDGFIVGWKVGHGLEATSYGVNEIIHFKYPNPVDPYGEGLSPVRAAWQRIQIGWKELGYLDSTLTNNARPDAILSPKDGISPLEAERLAKEFSQRFRGQGNGGVLVTDQQMILSPLNFPPKDLAELQLYNVIKTQICNVFHVPVDLLELGESNRATAEAALYSLAEFSIKPRMRVLVGKMNEKLLPLFDQGQGRLFLEAEDVVPDDKQFELQRDQMLLAQCVVTRNEIRHKYGYAPAPWAEAPLTPPGALPFGLDEPAPEEPAPEPTPAVDRSAFGPAIAALQQSYYTGQLPREAVIANARISYGFSPEEAAALFPEVAPNAPEAADQGGEPEAQPVQDNGQTPSPGPDQPEEAKGLALGSARKTLDLPNVRQETDYSCGAAAVASVCHFFGVGPATEAEYIEALGTSPEDGTNPVQVTSFLSSLGLAVDAKEELTLADLQRFTAEGKPVLVCLQDYGTDPEEEARLLSGHWVVVAGVADDLGAVQLQDPSAGPVEMDGRDFLARWQDQDGELRFTHFGIAVGRKPQDPEGKSYRTKAVRRKSPEAFVKALSKFIAQQRKAVLSRIKGREAYATKALPLEGWFDIDQWTREMARVMRPVVALYYDYSAKETISRIGASPDLLKVIQPQLKAGIDRATFLFCKETNEATSRELNAALAELRGSLTEGLEAGEVRNLLTKRVGAIFDGLQVDRSFRIAVTEASRAQHAAQEITAEESGLVQGKKWILSNDACPLCLPMRDKVVPLGQPFTQLEDGGPYSVVMYPPLHPHCRCDMVEVIEGVTD